MAWLATSLYWTLSTIHQLHPCTLPLLSPLSTDFSILLTPSSLNIHFISPHPPTFLILPIFFYGPFPLFTCFAYPSPPPPFYTQHILAIFPSHPSLPFILSVNCPFSTTCLRFSTVTLNPSSHSSYITIVPSPPQERPTIIRFPFPLSPLFRSHHYPISMYPSPFTLVNTWRM